jgi:RNA polymerase sigma factor (sigma-70 family)
MTTSAKPAKKNNSKTKDDASLVKDCIQGHELAWSSLIEKYKNLIFSIPIHYGFSEEDSADVFQSVCIDLLSELPHLREPQALPAWLIQVTRNKCFHRRQALQAQKVQAIDDLDQAAASRCEPENIITLVQQEQILRDALSELAPQCRELIRMLFLEEPPRRYQQVAKELKLAQGSIGFTRRSCLEKLKERLEALGYEPLGDH